MDWLYAAAIGLNAGLAFIPAKMARKKGYSFGGFWCLSFFVSFFIVIIIVACIADKPHQNNYCSKFSAVMNKGSNFCPACGQEASSVKISVNQDIKPDDTPNAFVNSYLGIILLAALLILTFIAGLSSKYFTAPQNLLNIFVQFSAYAAIAFAIALTIRAKGADISIGSVVMLSSIIIALNYNASGSVVLSLLLSFFICAAIGAVNGILAVFIKIPALITTLITSVIVRYIGSFLASVRPLICADFPRFASLKAGGISIGALLLLVASFLIAFLLILFTKLKEPIHKRNNKPITIYILAYIASSVIAAFVGFFMLSRVSSAFFSLSVQYEIYILFVFGCITSSRIAGAKYIPVIYAIAPALLWSMLINVLNLNSVSSFWQSVFSGLLALIFIIIIIVNRRGQNRKKHQS